MKVYYDDEVDALYLELGEGQPTGVTELTDGVNLDVTPDGRLLGIEVLHASRRLDLDTVLSYSLEVDRRVLYPAGASHTPPTPIPDRS
jgi:uncharacterized protein YuzE